MNKNILGLPINYLKIKDHTTARPHDNKKDCTTARPQDRTTIKRPYYNKKTITHFSAKTAILAFFYPHNTSHNVLS